MPCALAATDPRQWSQLREIATSPQDRSKRLRGGRLVFIAANCYCGSMLAQRIRRFVVLSLAVALAAGIATRVVPATSLSAKAADMQAMSMDKADAPVPGKCGGCGDDDKGLMPATCSVFCSPAVALPLLAVALDAVPVASLWPARGAVMSGRSGPPDPYPPRPTILS